MNSYLDVAVEAAREAGAILMTELARPVEINYKGEVDIVTQADGRSEQAIVTRLRNHFPKHAIVAEESGAHAAAAAAAAGGTGPRFCWYVDPLDGTTNFAFRSDWQKAPPRKRNCSRALSIIR
jgi:myo-inositol-1(or 4)-monophosphatase